MDKPWVREYSLNMLPVMACVPIITDTGGIFNTISEIFENFFEKSPQRPGRFSFPRNAVGMLI